jgi:hypothetical protein
MSKRTRAVVKRRDNEADRKFAVARDNRLTVDDALERVVNIYVSEGYRERTIMEEWINFSGGMAHSSPE